VDQRFQALLKNAVWLTNGCRNPYTKDNGWNSRLYPRSQIDVTLRCMFPVYCDWTVSYTRKGLLKAQLRRILGLFGAFSAIAALLWAMRTTSTMEYLVAGLKWHLAQGLDGLKSMVV